MDLNCIQLPVRKNATDKGFGWQAQNKARAENPLYKMVDLKRSGKGDLVEEYNKNGRQGLTNYCKTHLPEYLYNKNGDSKSMAREKYEAWRSEKYPGTSRYKSIDDSRPHVACWKLKRRGGAGETVLHLCYLHSTHIHNEIGEILLDLFPKLSLDIYEAEEYYGESALHLAIVAGNLKAVKLLVGKGANVNQRATGRFFLPDDQKMVLNNKTNYKGDAYYGEYPLSFAACFSDKRIYDFLIKNGANPNSQDSFGNTVLHLLVIHNLPKMYFYAATHSESPADQQMTNFYRENQNTHSSEQGLTPMALASKLGRLKVFEEIINMRDEFWRFNYVACSLHPIGFLDSIGPQGQINWHSPLMLAVNGEEEEHTDMIQEGVLRQLLDEKWKYFVKKIFILRLLLVIFHLCCLSTAVYLRVSSGDLLIHPDEDERYVKDICRVICEILSLIACLVALIIPIKESFNYGLSVTSMDLKHAPLEVMYLIGCVLTVLIIPIRLASIIVSWRTPLICLQRAEETLIMLALPLTWCMLLYFLQVAKYVGPLVTILFTMIRKDLAPFLLLLAAVYVTFTAAFWQLSSDKKTTHTLLETFLSLYKFMLGDIEFSEFELTMYPGLTKIVFIIFMFLTPVLLVNMLLATMTNTFKEYDSRSEKHYIHQWAKLVLNMERTVSKKELVAYQMKYTIPIPINTSKKSENENSERALMVIKVSKKPKVKNGVLREHERSLTKEDITFLKNSAYY